MDEVLKIAFLKDAPAPASAEIGSERQTATV
jgi:hypothetical protein